MVRRKMTGIYLKLFTPLGDDPSRPPGRRAGGAGMSGFIGAFLCAVGAIVFLLFVFWIWWIAPWGGGSAP